MIQNGAITTLFIDLGNVVLTDSWGPAMRQKALDRFGFDLAEVAERSRLTFEGYEEGKITSRGISRFSRLLPKAVVFPESADRLHAPSVPGSSGNVSVAAASQGAMG